MCLSLVFGEQASLAHAGVSCAGSWIFVGRLTTGELAVLSSHPITGTSAVAFPKRPGHALVPCPTAPCIGALIRGLLQGTAAVRGEEEDGIVYRSLTCIAPLEVMHNPDGGLTAVVPVAPYVEADMSQEMRHALTKPMLDCVFQGLDVHGIPHERLFGPGYDVETAPWQLVDMLHTTSTPGCDVVLGMAPENTKAATFSFLHVAPATACTIPFLGHVDGGYKAPMGVVTEEWTLLTNDPSLMFVMPSTEEGGFDVTILSNDLGAYRAAPSVQEECSAEILLKIGTVLEEASVAPLVPGPLRVQSLKGFDLPKDTVALRLERDWRAYNSPACVAQRARSA